MRKGFVSLPILIAILVGVAVVGAGGYLIFSRGQNETVDTNTGLSREVLSIPIVKQYISDASGLIEPKFLPFEPNSSELSLHLVMLPADWDKYKSSYFENGSPKFPKDVNNPGGPETAPNYSGDKKYALEFPTNEHGGANLWDLDNQYVYQLCSHCGISDSYWLDNNRFILLGVITPGQSDDNKYHKYIEFFNLMEKTITTYISAGVDDSESVYPINGRFKISDDKKTLYYGKERKWQVLLVASDAKNPYGDSFNQSYRQEADEFMEVFVTPYKNKVIISVCSACTADTNATWQFIYDLDTKSQKHILGNGVIEFSPDNKLIMTSDFSDGAGFSVYVNIVDFATGESAGQIRTSLAEGELGNKIAEFVKARGINLQEDFVPYTISGFTDDSNRLSIFTPNDAYYKYQWKFTVNFNGGDLQLESQSGPIPLVKYIKPIFKSFKSYLEGYREGGDWTNEYNSVINLQLADAAQNIYRSISPSGPWELIGRIKSIDDPQGFPQFKDILLPSRASKVFYKTKAANSFGEEGPDSDILEVTVPESDVMTATAFICNKNLSVAKSLLFLPIRVPVSNSSQIATEIINSLMKFEIKNVPAWYNWTNIFSSFPKDSVKLDLITIQDGIALVKFSAPFDFDQKDEFTQKCINGQVKNTLDQFAAIKNIELYWNTKKVFESSTLGGDTLSRFNNLK